MSDNAFNFDEDIVRYTKRDLDAYAAERVREVKAAVKVCMEQRGHIAFLDEYLPGGIFHADTLAHLERES